MTTTMKHKRSSVAGNAPDAADIETGELAINFPDAALYTKDGSGNIIELSITDAIKEPVKNVSGGSLSVGTVVYQSGTAGNSAEVQAASNSSASAMPALGIITSTLADEAEGYAVLIGKINGVNTSSFNEGDTLYVGASGTLTTTVPSGEGALIQNIGKVLKVHASNGSIMVTGAGRTNATPNLNDGNIFIGNSSNQATTGSLDTLVGAEGYAKLGTTSTTALAGNTSIPSDLTDLGITDGTNTQVLSTDGSGTFSFVDAAAGTDLINDTTPQLGGNLDANGNDIAIDDNNKIKFGADDDLEIYHDGTSSYINHTKTVTYGFPPPTPTKLILKSQLTEIHDINGDVALSATQSNLGGLKLYHAGSLRLQTYDQLGSNALDLAITGNTSVNGELYANGINLDDTKYLSLGNNKDFKIFHDGSDNYIRADGGNTDAIIIAYSISGTHPGENMARFEPNGAVKLYYDNSEKVATTNTGVDITGTVTADELSVDEYKVNTTETSTSATTQTAIKSISATSFRSARFTVQVTNTTDSTYHLTEVLVIHDGTTPSITEYGTIFTGAAAEATFDADISSNNLRLLATPASADSMTFKVVAHAITS